MRVLNEWGERECGLTACFRDLYYAFQNNELNEKQNKSEE